MKDLAMLISVTNAADGKRILLNTSFVLIAAEWGKGVKLSLSQNYLDKDEVFIKESLLELHALLGLSSATSKSSTTHR